MYVKFKHRVYYDEKNGYSVCKYQNQETKKNITCVGTDLPVIKNITYIFYTENFSSSRYGNSYKVTGFEEYINKSKGDIVAYLSCGLFPSISEKMAENIFDTFGENTLEILDKDVDSLLKVSGIGKKTLSKIKDGYIQKRVNRDLVKLLAPYGVSISLIQKISKKLEANALDSIKTNPYYLLDYSGIPFLTVDKLALDLGFKKHSYIRIQAASNYVLKEDMALGNVCMPKIEYVKKLIKVVDYEGLGIENILPILLRMIKDGTVRYNKRLVGGKKEEYLYYPKTYYVERQIARNILSLLDKPEVPVFHIESLIEKYSEGISLDNSQIEAIKMGVSKPIFIITGGPGTGKTTILKIIAKIKEELKTETIFLSPTGRAARRITESTGYPAKTIHSALGLGINSEESIGYDGEFYQESLQNKAVMVDEASMIDLWTFDSLLRSLENSSLGIIGDTDQLPSVRCGSILSDLLKSERVPCAKLTTIHRQSLESKNICENAYSIKKGEHTLLTGSDFNIIETQTLLETEEKLINEALYHISKYGSENTKILCPYKKGTCGVYRINSILQNEINPPKGELEVAMPYEMRLRVGDPVMQLRNMEEISNGDIGYVTSITPDVITVLFSGITPIEMLYTYQEARDNLLLGYATTIHKSQGSEYDSVILCLTKDHGKMKKRNILYTGITRGKSHVTLIGSMDAFYEAIDNNMTEDRHSMLSELLKNKDNIEKKPLFEQLTLPI